MKFLTKTDDHGVIEYRTGFILILTILAIAITVLGGGYLMYLAESNVGNANVTTWRDGTWLITMIMTTIGFGDFYPLTNEGRILGWIVFILGALELGTLIALASTALGTDSSIQNRELRTMLCELMRKLEHMEEHFNMDTSVNSNSNHLDLIIDQSEYSSDALFNGYLTIGQDSSGMFVMSVEAYLRETGKPYKRWIPADSKDQLINMFNRYLKNKKEL